VHGTFFDIGLGAGLAVSCGLRPFLPLLLAGTLARAGDLGLSFSSSSLHFLQSTAWLLVVTLALVASYVVQITTGRPATEERLFTGGDPFAATLSGLALGAGALVFAGTLAAHGDAWWPGIVAGLACALAGERAAGPLVARAWRRLPDRGARGALTLYLDAASLIAAAAVCALHVLGYVLLALALWWLIRSRGRGEQSYAGLRVLRR